MADNKKDFDEIENVEEIKKTKVKIDEDFEDEYEEVSVEDRIVNIEKKTNTIFVLVILIALLSFINIIIVSTKLSANSSTESSSSENSGYDTSEFDKIKGSDIASKSKNDAIVVMIGRQTCGYCAQYAPILADVQKQYGFTAKYIDLTEIIDMSAGSVTDQDSYDALMNIGTSKTCKSIAYDESGNEISCENFMSQEFGATPLTLVIKNNKLEYAIAGYVDKNDLSTHLESAGFSK